MTKHRDKALNSQAERVIRKFGGAKNLSRILLSLGRPRDPATIYRWTYPKEIGGTDGLIPTAAWPDLLMAARQEGIILTSEEIDPRQRSIEPIRYLKGGRPPLLKKAGAV